MNKKLALLLSGLFFIIGTIGFIPVLTPHGRLFGVLSSDSLLNIFYLVAGYVGLYSLTQGAKAIRMYFRLFGLIMGLVAGIGFVQQDNFLGVASISFANNLLHLVAAIAYLAIGFVVRFKD